MLWCCYVCLGGDVDGSDHADHEVFNSIGLACAEIAKQDIS